MLYDGRRLGSDGRKGTSTPSAPPKIRHSLSVTQTRETRYLFWLGTAGATRKHASHEPPPATNNSKERKSFHVSCRVQGLGFSKFTTQRKRRLIKTTKGTKVRALCSKFISVYIYMCIYIYVYMYIYIYIYIWWLIKMPLSGNGHSSRIKMLLSRNFRETFANSMFIFRGAHVGQQHLL